MNPNIFCTTLSNSFLWIIINSDYVPDNLHQLLKTPAKHQEMEIEKCLIPRVAENHIKQTTLHF